MQPQSVALILVSAVVHVYWNYQVKRSPQPALYTCWLMGLGAVLCAPFVIWTGAPTEIPREGWYCVGATGLLYAAYYTLMAWSYDRDDLSRAYPIARGVAPVATVVWGLLFHRELPSVPGLLGIAAVTLGVLALAWAGGPKSGAGLPLVGIVAAVGTGLAISGYAAVDKAGVQYVHPSVYVVLTFGTGALIQTALLLPRRGWRPFVAEARRARLDLLLASSLALGSYLLVLVVLRTEPVSYVVPLRSTSVLVSILAGARLLGETGGPARFGAALLIFAGIVGIALWG